MPRKQTKEITYLSKLEVEKLLKGIANIRDKAIFTLMYYHGLRASEIGKLEIRDVRLTDNRIQVHRLKGSISGDGIVGPQVTRVMRAWLRDRIQLGERFGTTLFPSNQNNPISRITIYKLFAKYAEAAGIPENLRHPHILKHSIATHLLESGEDASTVQDWLGHKDIRNTLVYAKVTNKRREEAAARFYGKQTKEGKEATP
jgi:site-specific recombinase XerD